VIEGALISSARWFPVIDGVPRLLLGEFRGDWAQFAAAHGLSQDRRPSSPQLHAAATQQSKTNATFSDKWRRYRRYGFGPEQQQFLNNWYVKKLGLSCLNDLPRFYQQKRCILEIGPGSGFNTQFMATHTTGKVMSVDISEAAVTTYNNTKQLPNCHVLQANLMNLPLRDETFDFVIADGVLHHTPDTRLAVQALYRKVAPGGQFFFYVYKRMGPARVFCDQHLRGQFSKLDPEDCYRACEGITELGRELSRLNARITLTKGIPQLGIPPGEHDVQRLLYYNFLKCFWNEVFDLETNNMVNFDWYHPHNAWQHTEEEVATWLAELGVRDFTFNPANPNGISVLLRKPG
ncbi:MAG: class I SAM-dependent methyltransferase, partial [Gammaproteobacteria bacterium]|nr:class I SAM-dependent methyltransferase [Gammaproteobacteria bacterium]